jgi:hypothetical protein
MIYYQAAASITNTGNDNIFQKVMTQLKPATVFPIPVPKGWSGTVMPNHACFTFNPASQG